MLARRSVLLLLICLTLGCSREDDSPGSLKRSILDATQLTYTGRLYVSDGGSIVFQFLTDSGNRISLSAEHPMKSSPGYFEPQVIQISGSARGGPFELNSGSDLENKLLRLLESARFPDKVAKDAGSDSPTKASLAWLVDRIRSRRQEWKPCP